MTYRTDPKKEQIWKTHVSQAKQYDGGFAAYCRSQNISVHTLSYWRRRFGRGSTQKTFRAPSPFIPVKVEAAVFSKSTFRFLPDPKWLAEVILELHARCQ